MNSQDMTDSMRGKVSDLIYGLERINQLIDLCIDRELFEYVEEILQVGKKCSQYLEKLVNNNGKISLEEFNFSKINFPILRITNPAMPEVSELFQTTQLFRSEKPPFELKEKGKSCFLLKYWSNLFWAKRVRAELQKYNKSGDWLDRYEDLTIFLENRIPTRKPPEATEADFYTTEFNYLMELSAVAQGEASLGYAERARKLLKSLFSKHDDPERGTYDRWISWNKGTAYQHSGRNQKAILEFNWVIKEFWWRKHDKHPNKIKKINLLQHIENFLISPRAHTDPSGATTEKHIKNVLEFIVNIVPATLQRAAINLKLQLGYHALQTLNLNDIDKCLEKIIKHNIKNLFSVAAEHLQYCVNLHRIDALLQLELLGEAENHIENAYKNIFKDDWKPKEVSLPSPQGYDHQQAVKTQLVEHIVKWFFQKAGQIIVNTHYFQNLKDPENRNAGSNICEEINQHYIYLKGLIKIFPEYWKWVEGNDEDERIFFSRWAQLLMRGIEAMDELQKLKQEISGSELETFLTFDPSKLLESTIELYLLHREKLPKKRKDRSPPSENEKTIELENFRSDDLPDFVSGLSSFYKKMSDVLLAKGKHPDSLKKVAEKTLIKSSNCEKSDDFLKKDHFQLLAALDEFEKEFGENQQIKFLKRCNERLWWFYENNENAAAKECETRCIKKGLFSTGSFQGLLKCAPTISSNDKPKFDLNCSNYEKIMVDAEDRFKKHLKSNSYQEPRKKALHFLGLQRWNSLTPAQGRSVGGGYLIYRTNNRGVVDLGIAIDPGFDFVRNFFRMGFSLRDIDIVIISHAHPDHLWDFESMIQLLHELEEKEQITHRLNVIMTLGSYRRLEHIITNPVLRCFINPFIIDIRKEIDPFFFNNLGPHNQGERYRYCFEFYPLRNDNAGHMNRREVCWQPSLPIDNNEHDEVIEIWPTRSYHDDYSERSDSFGFIIRFPNIISANSDTCFSFGYTGDTKWVGDDLYNKECPSHSACQKKYEKNRSVWKDVATQYKKCDALLIHLGSLIDHKKNKVGFSKYSEAKYCNELVRKENHLYLMGMIRFIKTLYASESDNDIEKLILIGEFGEELRGGIRIDLIKRIQDGIYKNIEKDWRILPLDVGLDVLLHDYSSFENHEDSPINCRFRFRCALCDKHCSINEVEYIRFGHDEAIFHICKTCSKAEPDDVRETKLRALYEVGRELRTLSDSF